jgi:hypothetical protein
MKLLLITVLAFLVFAQSACQDSSKELELRQKELALKEKELDMKAKEKDNEDKKDKDDKKEVAKEKPTATPEKKAEPTEKKEPAGSSGCGLTNLVRFKKGTSAQTFKCDLATNNGNTKHRYTLQAEAGQDLTITFKSTDASYDVTAPDGAGRFNGLTSPREQIPLNKDGKWIISVNLDPSVTFGDYTINFEIR